ncbi:MAG: hypothetical protein JNJ54_25575 [Myxococcaceae bacterium]|nr:hypothetical protein [Myxococcaceae bacterium]
MRPALLALVVCACDGAPPTPPAQAAGPPRADVTFTDVTVRQYRASQLRVVATAPRVELMRGSNDFTAADAGVRLVRSGVTVLAQRVSGNGAAQVATGFDGVLFLGNDGTVGRTERATYDRALGPDGAGLSDAGVSIEHPRFHLDAAAFYADFAEQRVEFESPVTRTKE